MHEMSLFMINIYYSNAMYALVTQLKIEKKERQNPIFMHAHTFTHTHTVALISGTTYDYIFFSKFVAIPLLHSISSQSLIYDVFIAPTLWNGSQ